MNDPIITVELTEEQAWALAQYAKRMTFSDAEAHAVDKAEAQQIIDAIVRLQNGLDQAGYSPR